MHVLKRIVIMTIALLLLLTGAGFLLAGGWQIERETVIHAPAATVFPYLVNLRQWQAWTVWGERHQAASTEYSGPETGPGATIRWHDGSSLGAIKIMQVRRNRTVDYELICNGGEQQIDGSLILVPVAEGTRVVWRVAGTAGADPLRRYAGLLQAYQLGRDIERSLARLRERLESAPR